MKDFLICFVSADRAWAEWVAWHLEQAGYSVTLAEWQAPSGAGFAADFQEAARQTRNALGILSAAFLGLLRSQSNWERGLTGLPAGETRALRLVRVQNCDSGRLFQEMVVADLAGLEDLAAREALLQAVRRWTAGSSPAPGFPGGSGRPVREGPRFPRAPARRGAALELAIEHGDITQFDADVVALKYAQDFYGADLEVARTLDAWGVEIDTLRPSIGEYRLVETRGCIRSRRALFVGVPPIWEFGYPQIGAFPGQVLEALSEAAPETRHVAMTIHGPGYGLDEVEAAMAQFAGCIEAVREGLAPPALERITVVERSRGRVERLRQALERHLEQRPTSRSGAGWTCRVEVGPEAGESGELREGHGRALEPGVASEAKPHAFVAMPFRRDMEDLFYYGIQRAVHASGLLCERIDQSSFTGDILEQLKQRIEEATVVIAELSHAMPNVYLEVGYAWGKGRPTILLVNDPKHLHFDLCGQRCLIYESIRDLEERLTRELRQLRDRGQL